jgi:hypothetical protein
MENLKELLGHRQRPRRRRGRSNRAEGRAAKRKR